jgi:thiosulfate/3-mercaptopyruvate sulfurtransferase
MTTARAAVVAAAVTIVGLASGHAQQNRSGDARQMLVVSTAWLASHLTDANLVLFHMGTRADYDAAHIPGARFLTLGEIAVTDSSTPAGLALQMPEANDLRSRLEKIGISDDSRIILSYGRDRIAMATRVLYTLDYAGLGDRVSLLDGGMEAWTREKRPVTTEVPAAKAGQLGALKVQALSVVDAEFVKGKIGTPGFVVIDARTPNFYSGAQTGGSADRPHRAGHIAGAANVPYTDTLAADQTLKPAADLSAMFAAAGAKPGDTVIGYCHIGQQATAMLFAARTLGFKVLLYDGSFEDWSRKADLPVNNPSKKLDR